MLTPQMAYNRALSQINVYLIILARLGPDDEATRYAQQVMSNRLAALQVLDRAAHFGLMMRMSERRAEVMRDRAGMEVGG